MITVVEASLSHRLGSKLQLMLTALQRFVPYITEVCMRTEYSSQASIKGFPKKTGFLI